LFADDLTRQEAERSVETPDEKLIRRIRLERSFRVKAISTS
jgi:hypothetical protein